MIDGDLWYGWRGFLDDEYQIWIDDGACLHLDGLLI